MSREFSANPDDDFMSEAEIEISDLRAQLSAAKIEIGEQALVIEQQERNMKRLEGELSAAQAEIERLAKLVYVPGQTRCAKCKFVLISTEINAGTGQFRVNNEPQECPNGCGPMWRVTERDAGNELIDSMDEMADRHKAEIATLRKLLGDLVEIGAGWGTARAQIAALQAARDYLQSAQDKS